jgi:hypothetical protein
VPTRHDAPVLFWSASVRNAIVHPRYLKDKPRAASKSVPNPAGHRWTLTYGSENLTHAQGQNTAIPFRLQDPLRHWLPMRWCC